MKKLLKLLKFIYDKLDNKEADEAEQFTLLVLCSLPTTFPILMFFSLLFVPFPHILIFSVLVLLAATICFGALFSFGNSIYKLWNEYNNEH